MTNSEIFSWTKRLRLRSTGATVGRGYVFRRQQRFGRVTVLLSLQYLALFVSDMRLFVAQRQQ